MSIKMDSKCQACGQIGIVDRAHIRSKGAGGSWDSDNIILLCRKHHQESHSLGWYRFVILYPKIMFILEEKGFEFKNIFGIMKLIKRG